MASAASTARRGGVVQACRRPAPGADAASRASANGSSASSMVLSPSSALPKRLHRGRRRAARRRASRRRSTCVGVAERGADRGRKSAPEHAAGAAGLVAPGVAGRGQHRADPPSAASAAAAAAAAAAAMPTPWSPSPATASIWPSSSSCSRDVASWRGSPRARSPPRRRRPRWPPPRPPGLPSSVTAATGWRSVGWHGACRAGRPGVSAGASQSVSSSSSSQVRVSEQPAMSRLVTSSPTSGATSVDAGLLEQRARRRQSTNSSSYLVEPSPLRSTAARPLGSAGPLREDGSTSSAASSARRHPGRRADPGLAVDAQPEVHLAGARP